MDISPRSFADQLFPQLLQALNNGDGAPQVMAMISSLLGTDLTPFDFPGNARGYARPTQLKRSLRARRSPRVSGRHPVSPGNCGLLQAVLRESGMSGADLPDLDSNHSVRSLHFC